MLKKFLRDVITLIVGKQAEEIADLLNNKKHVNEFLIAKKLDITINQTRNILYKISNHGLVSFIRKKDKKKGWYTYFWKIDVLKSLEFLKAILIKKVNQINNQVKSRESKEFYICKRCNIEFNEENALLYDFTCNECGGIFSLKDNTKILREFKRNLDKLKKELSFIDEEINKEKEKLEKEKLKEIKKQEKIKDAKKKVIKSKKLLKKKTKKVIKKKSVKKKSVKKKPKGKKPKISRRKKIIKKITKGKKIIKKATKKIVKIRKVKKFKKFKK